MRVRRTAKKERYHHGDLRAALIDTAIDLIGEHGVRGFSLAEASRRLGVTVAAPYRHFADRDELLAAVAARAYEVLGATLLTDVVGTASPADRLAAAAGAYVRFAADNRPLFQALFGAGLDKSRHPELEQAAQPLAEALLDPVRALSGGDEDAAQALGYAVIATAHGYAVLLQDGAFGHTDDATDLAAEAATKTTQALIAGRQALRD